MLGVKKEITKSDWLSYANRVLKRNGKPTTKDAEECNIPFVIWFEASQRNTPTNYIDWANEVIKHYN